MLKITQKAIQSFLNAESFNSSNTKVKVLPNVTVLILFGNEIAYLYNDPDRTLSITTRGYNTQTTMEILNGLPNVKVCIKKGILYLNGVEWDGNLIDVK